MQNSQALVEYFFLQLALTPSLRMLILWKNILHEKLIYISLAILRSLTSTELVE